MSEFAPLRETSTSAFERALLRAAEHDEPSPRALSRTAVALGVSGTIVGTAGTTAAATGKSAVVTFWTIALKPLLIGAAGGLVVAVSAHRLQAPSDRATSVPPAVSPAARADSPRSEAAHAAFGDPPNGVTPVPEPDAGELEVKSQYPRYVTGPGPETKTPGDGAVAPAPSGELNRASASASSIAQEVASLDRARQALRDGRSSEALHELDRYRAAWPSGVLATEATVLRIEGHLALGDRSSAVRVARAFLATMPSGRYESRVRALLNPWELE